MAKTIPSHQKKLSDIYSILHDHFGPQNWWPGDTPFEIAVGAILTQNTNWQNVEKAVNNLKKADLLHAEALHALPHERLAPLIRPAGYFNVKTRRLKNFLSFLANHYRGSMVRMKKEDTRKLRKLLLEVNGIGPETADSILLYALGKPVFVVDAYTKRILSRHGLVADSSSYHEIQDLFQKSLPSRTSLYNEFHALLVMLGKHYCRPNPGCHGCPLETLPGSP